jgi:hypothetical protein
VIIVFTDAGGFLGTLAQRAGDLLMLLADERLELVVAIAQGPASAQYVVTAQPE